MRSLPQGAEVLLLRLRSLGDLVLETSVIRALHEWRPDLRISVLADERFAAVFEGNPAVAEVIPPGGLMATASELRRRNFAVLFNQHGGPRSAMLTAMSGARTKVGWHGYQYDFVYDVKVPDAREFFAGAEINFRSKVGPVALGFRTSPFLVMISKPRGYAGRLLEVYCLLSRRNIQIPSARKSRFGNQTRSSG